MAFGRSDKKSLSKTEPASSSGEVAAFLDRIKTLGPVGESGRGRLLFALDATLSRQPTWDLACQLQAEMFKAAGSAGALDVQLVYFRGIGECRASKWVSDSTALARLMSGIGVRGGATQIGRVFAHARREHAARKINAIVYVGDAMEEDVDRVIQQAGDIGLLGCPIFVFQEGREPKAERTFREFARVSKGAYARFDAGAPAELAALLRAVAAYASGGRKALQLQASPSAKLLLEQMK